MLTLEEYEDKIAEIINLTNEINKQKSNIVEINNELDKLKSEYIDTKG